MKITERLLYISAEIVYIVCVTLTALHFNNTALLWWYLLVLFLRAYKG